MRDSEKQIDEFLVILRKHAIRKSMLYDGVKVAAASSPDVCLRYATEELGEIAAALTRERLKLAEYESIDLAHAAMLIWMSLAEKT